MLSRLQLQFMAAEKLKAAYTLFDAGDFVNARYMCGYAVELMLKRRICVHHNLPGWPESDRTCDCSYE
jgi:HEPN domain-containing protein